MASRTSASAVRGGAFDVCDFGGCADRVGVRGMVEETAGELGFEDDDGERVAENVMQVAGDAFALGDGGEGYVFFLRGAEQAVGALLLSEEDVAAADDDRDEDGDVGVGPADVEGVLARVEDDSLRRRRPQAWPP